MKYNSWHDVDRLLGYALLERDLEALMGRLFPPVPAYRPTPIRGIGGPGWHLLR